MSASYPSAVKVFAARSNGQTIDATHVGDLQDEVSAIEDGILNGTAPVVSSNTRVNNLQVGGNSTLAGALSVAGGSTLASLTVTAPPASARVTHSAAQNINNSVVTALTFDTERWMTVAGMHSTVTNATRLVPPSSGLYVIAGCVSWQGGSTGSGVCALGIRVDGSSIVANVQDKDPSGLIQNVVAHYYFRSTAQYAELVATQNSGSTKSIAVTADYSPDFMMTKMI